MPRKSQPREPKAPLPPPLPPETRTVGQLVAETVRLYRTRFWPSLALGIGPALLALFVSIVGPRHVTAFALGFWAVVMTVSYVGACVIVAPKRPGARELAIAVAAGAFVSLPVPLLAIAFIFPAVAWLALVGLAVPVAIIEGLGFRDSLSRALRLARADYVHALGSLATLAIVFALTNWMLVFLLRGGGEATARIASLLASLVLSPLLFLGAALLYFDQAARVSSGRPRRERSPDADVSDAVDSHRPGRANAEVESRPAAGSQPRR